MKTQEIELNKVNFDAETSAGLTLAFFWEPCDSSSRREWKIIERAADMIGEQLRVGRCSVEDSPELAGRLSVRSIPTTIIFKDGKEEDRIVGLRHKGTLIRHLKKQLEHEA